MPSSNNFSALLAVLIASRRSATSINFLRLVSIEPVLWRPAGWKPALPGSGRILGPGQQIGKIIIDAGHTKIWLTLKGSSHIMDTMVISVKKLDNR